ncbi:hypothetical protein ACXR2W_11580 [Leucobacter sp. HY1908]
MKTILLAVAVVLFVAPFASTPALAQDSDLISVSPASSHISMPAPGHTETWSTEVRNVAKHPVDVDLSTVNELDEVLRSGSTPARITIVDSAGRTLLDDLSVTQLQPQIPVLGQLDPGESISLTGTVSLPAEAGNEYQGASGNLQFTFVAQTSDTHGVTDALAETGAPLAAAGIAAALLIGTGAVIMRRKTVQK